MGVPDRENQHDHEFDVQLTEHRDGWRCTVQRGAGTVRLSGGPFKTEAAASVWALKAVTAILRLEIESAFPPPIDLADCQAALAAVVASLNVAQAPQDIPCRHCGHGADEHEPREGHCTGGCPCHHFAAVLR